MTHPLARRRPRPLLATVAGALALLALAAPAPAATAARVADAFHLATGSVGKNAASDGTDTGI
jgi:hypothetical protein